MVESSRLQGRVFGLTPKKNGTPLLTKEAPLVLSRELFSVISYVLANAGRLCQPKGGVHESPTNLSIVFGNLKMPPAVVFAVQPTRQPCGKVRVFLEKAL
jgi:hypothetical protein